MGMLFSRQKMPAQWRALKIVVLAKKELFCLANGLCKFDLLENYSKEEAP
jgi:hypothetical protein